MSARIDLVGKTYGDFLVISHAGKLGTHATWNVSCTKCGRRSVITGNNLKAGYSKHCQKCNSQYGSLDMDQEQELIKMYQDRQPIWKIQKKFDVSPNTIYATLLKYDIKVDRMRSKPPG